MHVSCINAGNFLARLGRPEVFQCIKALEQYSYAYEESKEHAREITREYDLALQKGPNNFNEMASAIRQPSPRNSHSDAMSVDAITNGNGKYHGNTVSHFLYFAGGRLTLSCASICQYKKHWSRMGPGSYDNTKHSFLSNIQGSLFTFRSPSTSRIHMDSYLSLCSYQACR